MSYTREDWVKAKADLDAIEAERHELLAPTIDRFCAAQERLEEVEDNLGGFVAMCEGCATAIFEGDKYHVADVYLCEPCAPSYQDMIDHPDHFEDADGEQMTRELAQTLGAAHVSAGGCLSDKMAT